MYKFKIESLNCMSCFRNIEDALKDFDPAIEAKADARNQTLTVQSTHSAEKITKLIEAAGYPVDLGHKRTARIFTR